MRGKLVNTPEDMTIDDALSGYLKIAKSTLHKLAQEGKVPSQRVGRHWRFDRAAIDEWLRQGQEQPPG